MEIKAVSSDSVAGKQRRKRRRNCFLVSEAVSFTPEPLLRARWKLVASPTIRELLQPATRFPVESATPCLSPFARLVDIKTVQVSRFRGTKKTVVPLGESNLIISGRIGVKGI